MGSLIESALVWAGKRGMTKRWAISAHTRAHTTVPCMAGYLRRPCVKIDWHEDLGGGGGKHFGGGGGVGFFNLRPTGVASPGECLIVRSLSNCSGQRGSCCCRWRALQLDQQLDRELGIARKSSNERSVKRGIREPGCVLLVPVVVLLQ